MENAQLEAKTARAPAVLQFVLEAFNCIRSGLPVTKDFSISGCKTAIQGKQSNVNPVLPLQEQASSLFSCTCT